MNINTRFHSSFTSCALDQSTTVLVQRQRRVVNKAVKMSLVQADMEKLWPWFWQGLLAALIMDSAWVCVYQPSPLSTSLAKTLQTPCRKGECSRTKT